MKATDQRQNTEKFGRITEQLKAAVSRQLELRGFFRDLDAHLSADKKRVAALGRMLQIYASKGRKYSSNNNSDETENSNAHGPSYTLVYRDISRLNSELRTTGVTECVDLISPSSAHTLRQFLNGVSDTMTGGAKTYRLLSLYLTWIVLGQPSFKEVGQPSFEEESRLAGDDVRLLQDLKGHWTCLAAAIAAEPGAKALSELAGSPLTELRSRTALGDEETREAEIMRRYVASFFRFPEQRHTEFRQFFENSAYGEDDCAHFICYRPQLSDPSGIVKSFLAILPPQRNGMRRNFTFTHIYSADPDFVEIRKSTGVVLPMTSGLYFIGGQQLRSRRDETSSPGFRTLKVIAVPRLPIERRQDIIPALCLSTNNREQLIVSRLALRRTVATDDRSANIGIMKWANLSADLQGLVDLEIAAQQVATNGGIPVRFQHNQPLAAQIRRIWATMNNCPAVSTEGFFQKSTKRRLNGGMAKELLEAAFQTDGEAEYIDSTGNGLTWENLRFGPLGVA